VRVSRLGIGLLSRQVGEYRFFRLSQLKIRRIIRRDVCVEQRFDGFALLLEPRQVAI
jgi:hypothetical protein